MMFWIVISLAGGFLIGWHLHAAVVARLMSDLLKVFGVSEAQLIKSLKRIKDNQDDAVCSIRVEKDGDILRAYRIDDSQFLAQGKNTDELVEGIIRTVGKGVYVQCSLEHGGEIFRDTAEKYQKNLH